MVYDTFICIYTRIFLSSPLEYKQPQCFTYYVKESSIKVLGPGCSSNGDRFFYRTIRRVPSSTLWDFRTHRSLYLTNKKGVLRPFSVSSIFFTLFPFLFLTFRLGIGSGFVLFLVLYGYSFGLSLGTLNLLLQIFQQKSSTDLPQETLGGSTEDSLV